MIVKEVTNMWIFQSRYRVEINKVPSGNWVLIEGIDLSIPKVNMILNQFATVTHAKDKTQMEILKPIEFFNQPYFKVSVEPLNPSGI